MGRRTYVTTADIIRQAALPQHASTYTVISHGEIMDAADSLLKQSGISVSKVLYKTNYDCEVVRAIYHLGESQDPDLEMMFAWVNSYDKSKRFQTVVGCSILASGGYWIGGNMGSYTRKHTGNAKQEAIDAMSMQISNAGTYFNSLVKYKEEMKLVILPEKLRAELLGRVLFEKGYITIEQASIVKTELMKSVDYNANKDSLWVLMSVLNLSLEKSHPRDWMSRCIQTSVFLTKEFGIGEPKGDPNQISLLDSIKEIEAENQSPEVPPEPIISFEL